MATGSRFSWTVLALVFAGGSMGTAARLGILLVEDPSMQWLSIPLINVIGSFLLGLVFGWATRFDSQARAARARSFWGVGVMGGFTTYSTFAVMALDPRLLPVAAASILLGLAAAVAGLWLSRPRSTPGAEQPS